MSKHIKSVGMGMFLAVALLAGCGPDKDTDGTEQPAASARCDDSSADYLAFDVNNHKPQDDRLTAIDAMVAMFTAAESDPSTAATQATALLAKYQDPSTNLQAKVKGREDKHFTGDAAAVGPALDKTITDAIEALRVATTKPEVSLAKQSFQKAGIYRFLYLSVMEELYEPSFEHYDEAYGYLGTGASNAEAGRRSLAKVATSRDADNGTTLSTELFSLMKEGSCLIETALKAKGTDSMEFGDDENYARFVQRFDAKLQSVLVYTMGHELHEIDLDQGSPDKAYLELVETEGVFRTIEPYLKLSAGSARANLAAELRTAFDAALAKARAGDTTWIADFKAGELLGKLETVFAIDVKN
ncbi:hypothetical protein [Archangium sp.]|uniref:hypothetical protein n=1 Tax=Archangium sp. TaxID=1872627 RepID=UPI00389B2613